MITVLFTDSNGQETDDERYSRLRSNMVQSQIIRRGIQNPQVIQAMMKVPRHLFIPAVHRNEAYEDHPVPIGNDQTISQPYIVAYMTEILNLKPTDRVLEIGTGSGYQAAVLAEICDSVFTIELFEELGRGARKTLADLNYHNVKVKIGDGYQGWSEKAPFDAIIVTCAPTHIPKPLCDQLKEGGKMIIPVGEFYNQELQLLIKKSGLLDVKDVLPVRFVPMIDDKGKKY